MRPSWRSTAPVMAEESMSMGHCLLENRCFLVLGDTCAPIGSPPESPSPRGGGAASLLPARRAAAQPQAVPRWCLGKVSPANLGVPRPLQREETYCKRAVSACLKLLFQDPRIPLSHYPGRRERLCGDRWPEAERVKTYRRHEPWNAAANTSRGWK
ncbi:hypothetical protein P154DRAFT_205598 [Amniculicola lignicola CBS 123094]|uniref:Uncharacterized protein n=1 Tax=Amniculicola lignicola CBS 123094 TaxID=1392246 RepID=A0A6A5WDL9_9PLEO|nr:hypothetical protein P154DRAFT_205598 [Amniculicola lignicola CBS 123094]